MSKPGTHFISKSLNSDNLRECFDLRFRSCTSSYSLSLSLLSLVVSSFLALLRIPAWCECCGLSSKIVSIVPNRSKSSGSSLILCASVLLSCFTLDTSSARDPQASSPPSFHIKLSRSKVAFLKINSVSRARFLNLMARDKSLRQLRQMRAGIR